MDLILEKYFNFKKIELFSKSDVNLHAVLIDSKLNKSNKKCVLYIHGFIDYFFHPHVAQEFHKNEFDFFALDLRRYGRSLLAHQKPNYCSNIEEYFEEITAAINIIKQSCTKIYLLGHSTGGLIGSCYMNTGELKNSIAGLILNSPFFDLAQPKFFTKLLYYIVKPLAFIFPNGNVSNGLSAIYASSLHKDYNGEWDFNLDWKPIQGYPIYFKWFVAIVDAQRSLRKSDIQVPVLLLHSKKSFLLKKNSDEVKVSDTVLNIEDMKNIGSVLGDDVTIIAIENALHDVFLSARTVRETAFLEMFNWLEKKTCSALTFK
ncbi:alpha/beta hydrolase [Flavicella sp.]|uniref:alpha/beta hydrolase n=1 Tax=Flavicella sp. TaxID=2957742 RepID=UPI003017CEDB